MEGELKQDDIEVQVNSVLEGFSLEHRQALTAFVRIQLEDLQRQGKESRETIEALRKALLAAIEAQSTSGVINVVREPASAHLQEVSPHDSYRHTADFDERYHTGRFQQIRSIFNQHRSDKETLNRALEETILPLIRGEQPRGILAHLKRSFYPDPSVETLSPWDLAEIAQMFEGFPKVDQALTMYHAEKLDHNTRMLLLKRLGNTRASSEEALALLTRGKVTLEHKRMLLKNENLLFGLMDGGQIEALVDLLLLRDGGEVDNEAAKDLNWKIFKLLTESYTSSDHQLDGSADDNVPPKDVNRRELEKEDRIKRITAEKIYDFALCYVKTSNELGRELNDEVVTEIAQWIKGLPCKDVERTYLDRIDNIAVYSAGPLILFFLGLAEGPSWLIVAAIFAIFPTIINTFIVLSVLCLGPIALATPMALLVRSLNSRFHEKYRIDASTDRSVFSCSQAKLQSGNRICKADPLIQALFTHLNISGESLATLAAALPLIDFLSIFWVYLHHPNANPNALATTALDRALPMLPRQGQRKVLQAFADEGNEMGLARLVEGGNSQMRPLAQSTLRQMVDPKSTTETFALGATVDERPKE